MEPVISQPGTYTTIILARHAERNEGLDPPLNQEGVNRAEALASVVSSNGITAMYCPDQLRNRQTCEAVDDRMDIGMNIIAAPRLLDTRALANDLVDEILEKHAGGVVLFVGNNGPVTANQSGNLQELYARLGGTGREPSRYEDLYIIIVPDEGDPRFIKASYGGKSSLDP
jgi:broad specificity phosphatase PhoE